VVLVLVLVGYVILETLLCTFTEQYRRADTEDQDQIDYYSSNGNKVRPALGNRDSPGKSAEGKGGDEICLSPAFLEHQDKSGVLGRIGLQMLMDT
jgi:hypothetical protein